MDPDDIISALKDGSRWAGPAMVTVVAPVLWGYAAAVAPDLSASDHEQAVEAAILQGVRKLERFDRRRGTFEGWLRPFVLHALADIRRERGHPVLPLPTQVSEPARDSDDDPVAAAEAEAIKLALAGLSDTDRLIITLRDYEHLDYDACAERIGGVSAAACRVRHHRALKRLADAARAQGPLVHYFEEGN